MPNQSKIITECQGFSQEVAPIQEDYKSVITGFWYVFKFPVNTQSRLIFDFEKSVRAANTNLGIAILTLSIWLKLKLFYKVK